MVEIYCDNPCSKIRAIPGRFHTHPWVAGPKIVLNCDFCDTAGPSNLKFGIVITYTM